MKHIHLKQCDSTQTYLKEHYSSLEDFHVLISSEFQNYGQGRKGDKWESIEQALMMSFTLCPNDQITLSGLEVSVLLSQFLLEKFNIHTKLKWPNDLLNSSGKKLGGVIIHIIEKDTLCVGAGINLFGNIPHHLSDIATTLLDKKTDFTIKDLSINVYEYILKNRLHEKDVIKKWNHLCFHQNMPVHITDGETINSGLFLGINEDGSAKLKTDNGTEIKVYTGSLSFN